jgi:hypothetical protein
MKGTQNPVTLPKALQEKMLRFFLEIAMSKNTTREAKRKPPDKKGGNS